MIILKIGGSVITNKTKQNSFKQSVMSNLSKEIKKANKEIILVHGAGSFGHILAKKYDLNKGYVRKDQINGYSLTHANVQRLNTLVLDCLHKNNVPGVSLSPHTVLKLSNHKLSEINYRIFEEYLKSHFVPVTFGDVVLDEKLGFSICSGDLLVSTLAEHFRPEKVVFVIDEDGLYTANPKINKNAKLMDDVTLKDLEMFTTAMDSHADVTRGMGGKIDIIKNVARLGIDTVLLNGNKPGRLYHVLAGKDTKCTVVRGL